MNFLLMLPEGGALRCHGRSLEVRLQFLQVTVSHPDSSSRAAILGWRVPPCPRMRWPKRGTASTEAAG